MAPHDAIVIAFFLLLISSSAAPSAHGQAASAPAPAPAPAPPKTITAVLTKAGQFTKFLQLLKSTQEADQITNQLKGKSSTGGFTVFAPPDNAFAALPAGTLNSLSDEQKTALVQFHVVPQLLPAAQLDTVSNPVRTQAGDTGRGKFPLNVTSDSGGRQVNVSTGVVNATVDNTVYAGERLVVYQVSKVLLPWALYGPPVPPAPAPVGSGKKKKKAAGPEDQAVGDDDDAAVGVRGEAEVGSAWGLPPWPQRYGGGACDVTSDDKC
ncbi:hypothetical protein PR202_ga11373 [Eleusine coracana subsp. coracana]|uniref:FAS1 domain-containing protein n=1 Tax=Eleusine coracana subsp. coracana TaxID=191504 RepID=A0AAV5C9E3_ELECO|nr:hypothetical protein PR202_ga11373 [Eleusine coracana subsp. coracana]